MSWRSGTGDNIDYTVSTCSQDCGPSVVECDYEQCACEDQSDFGDYSPFGIARHVVIDAATDGTPDNMDAVWLGATVDYETAQNNSVDALGDDNDGMDDEDAISNFPSDLENGTGLIF